MSSSGDSGVKKATQVLQAVNAGLAVAVAGTMAKEMNDKHKKTGLTLIRFSFVQDRQSAIYVKFDNIMTMCSIYTCIRRLHRPRACIANN